MIVILELKNIVKSYRLKKQNIEALKGISFNFPNRGMFFIVGKSGSGKSTMLNILGLLDEYDSGEYVINGKCSKTLSEDERDSFRALNIGFVFQEFHIIEKYTIGQNISLPLEIQKQEESGEQVRQALKTVGLDGFENRKPSEISGGQKQRVAIARAIVKNPAIILADEPTGSLDSTNGNEIFNLLHNLSKEKLVIIISHDTESANKYADCIVELKDGLVDDVYEGDGGAEQIKFVVDKIQANDAEKYNALLDEGKKITLSKTKPPKQTVEMQPVPKINPENKKVRLPFKSSLKLSLFSLKSTWVRTFFTILVSMFAIAFFGFADIISKFDSDKLIAQELNKENRGYINVGIEHVDTYGIVKNSHETGFLDGQIEKFENVGLEAYPTRSFLHVPYFTLPDKRAQITSKYAREYYNDSLLHYTECDDVSRLGLNIIAGRAPEDTFDILITSYHMQCLEALGFNNGEISIDSVKNFGEIEGMSFSRMYYGSEIALKIVGLVEVDMSEYQELTLASSQSELSAEEQELLLAKFIKNQYDINNIFVKKGFFEAYETLNAPRRLRSPRLTYRDEAYGFGDSDYYPVSRITNELLNDSATILKEGIADYKDLASDKVIFNWQTIKILSTQAAAYESAAQFCADSEILGSKLTLNATYLWNRMIRDMHTEINTSDFEIEVELIGVCDSEDSISSIYISQNLIDGSLFLNAIISYKVAAASGAERLSAIKKLSGVGEFVADGEASRFFFGTDYQREIAVIKNYFSLFVDIFSILALVFCVFAMILTFTFINQSIMLRKKDIGILRSLGARKKDIAGIFAIEGFIIAVLEILFAITTCYGGFRILERYFIGQLGAIAQAYSIVNFGPRQIFLMIVATMAAITISMLLPVFRISKKRPMDTIRN